MSSKMFRATLAPDFCQQMLQCCMCHRMLELSLDAHVDLVSHVSRLQGPADLKAAFNFPYINFCVSIYDAQGRDIESTSY